MSVHYSKNSKHVAVVRRASERAGRPVVVKPTGQELPAITAAMVLGGEMPFNAQFLKWLGERKPSRRHAAEFLRAFPALRNFSLVAKAA